VGGDEASQSLSALLAHQWRVRDLSEQGQSRNVRRILLPQQGLAPKVAFRAKWHIPSRSAFVPEGGFMGTETKSDGEQPQRAQWTKEERQADAIQAKADHDAEALAVEEKTARLRSLRLSKEAEDREQEKKLAAKAARAAKKKAAEKKARAAARTKL